MAEGRSPTAYLRRANGLRYLAVKGSESAHCCFEGTVLDLHAPYLKGGLELKDDWRKRPREILGFESVCECFNHANAVRLADILNSAEAKASLPPTSVDG